MDAAWLSIIIALVKRNMYGAGMETTFARWLRENECSVNQLAKESGLHHRGLYRLAGIRGFAGDRGGVHFTEPFLDRVAEITGIAPATLVSDAWAARESPRAPRKYIRKRITDVATIAKN